MSTQDAEKVIEHLEKAKQAAKPLRDKELNKRLESAEEHVKSRVDPHEGPKFVLVKD